MVKDDRYRKVKDLKSWFTQTDLFSAIVRDSFSLEGSAMCIQNKMFSISRVMKQSIVALTMSTTL